MKESEYNFFVKNINNDKGYIAFNSRTCALAELDEIDYNDFIKSREDGFTSLKDSLFKDLVHGGFLINDEFSEKDSIKYVNQLNRYSNSTQLSLTLVPTLKCNFRCIYCYEQSQEKSGKMSKEVQDGIYNYIRNSLYLYDTVFLSWYGGEPLLALDVIEDLSERVIKLCDENNKKFRADIVTNGYNLTPKVYERLKKSRINDLQITIDGCSFIHDVRRPLQNGNGTFDIIMKNLYELTKRKKEDDLDIFIRINVDKKNASFLEMLYKEILSYGINMEDIEIYLARVDSINDTYEDDECLDHSNFNQIREDFVKHVYGTENTVKYPQPQYMFCGSERVNSYTVGPLGELYKCWHNVGYQETIVATIQSDGDMITYEENLHKFLDFMTYDVFENENCYNCKLLPMCMGGCKSKRISGRSACIDLKYGSMEKYLNEVRQDLINQVKEEVV